MKRSWGFLIVFLFVSFRGLSQPEPESFQWDHIPEVGEEVVFSVVFKYDFSKDELHHLVSTYLNNQFRPYSGGFIEDNSDYSSGKVTEFILVDSSAFRKFGIYINYHLDFIYNDRACNMIIRNIEFIEKNSFEEADKDPDKKRRKLQLYSGKDIMIDHIFKVMFVKHASERITKATVERINRMIREIDRVFNAGISLEQASLTYREQEWSSKYFRGVNC